MYCEDCKNIGHIKGNCATPEILFKWNSWKPKQVFISLSSDNWQINHELLKNKDNIKQEYYFYLKMHLKPGKHEFKFLVDGEWMHDHNLSTCYDNFGGFNNFLEVKPIFEDEYIISKIEQSFDLDKSFLQNINKIKITLKLENIPKEIIKWINENNELFIVVKGSWDNWENPILLKKKKNYINNDYFYTTKLKLLFGKYQFKFIFNNSWFLDKSKPIVKDINNNDNHFINILNSNIIMNSSYLNLVKAYWECFSLKDGNFNLYGHSLNIIGNKIYIFGGCKNGGNLKNCIYEFDPIYHNYYEINDMKNIDNMPSPRAFHKTISYGQKILFFGGTGENNLFMDYYSYNTIEKIWTKSNTVNCPTPREKFSLNSKDGNKFLYLFGGYNYENSKHINYNELFVLYLQNLTWQLVDTTGDIPKGRCFHTGNIIENILIIFGGLSIYENEEIIHNDTYKIKITDSNKKIWQIIKPKGKLPMPRYGHFSCVIGNKIVINGGLSEKKVSLNDVYVWDINQNIWFEVNILGLVKPNGRYNHNGILFNNNEIIILGGKSSDNKKLSYFDLWKLVFEI